MFYSQFNGVKIFRKSPLDFQLENRLRFMFRHVQNMHFGHFPFPQTERNLAELSENAMPLVYNTYIEKPTIYHIDWSHRYRCETVETVISNVFIICVVYLRIILFYPLSDWSPLSTVISYASAEYFSECNSVLSAESPELSNSSDSLASLCSSVNKYLLKKRNTFRSSFTRNGPSFLAFFAFSAFYRFSMQRRTQEINKCLAELHRCECIEKQGVRIETLWKMNAWATWPAWMSATQILRPRILFMMWIIFHINIIDTTSRLQYRIGFFSSDTRYAILRYLHACACSREMGNESERKEGRVSESKYI